MKTSEKLKNYIEEVWLQKLTPFLDSKRMDVVLEYLKITPIHPTKEQLSTTNSN